MNIMDRLPTASYTIIGQIGEEYICPVTKELLVEPYQSLCCGQHFSKEAVDRLLAQNAKCPICRTLPWKCTPDKAFKRSIHQALRVKCCLHNGCTWTGSFSDFLQHCGMAINDTCTYSQNSPTTTTIVTKDVKVFKMENFSKYLKEGTYFQSPTFYTHSKGYKMCIRVYPSGYYACKGTHVCVVAYLMNGQFDDRLQFPFRSSITIQVLNHISNGEDYERIFDFNDKTDDIICTRVPESEEMNSGLAMYNFIPLTELQESTKGQYLKDDNLTFKVSKIIVKSCSEEKLPNKDLQSSIVQEGKQADPDVTPALAKTSGKEQSMKLASNAAKDIALHRTSEVMRPKQEVIIRGARERTSEKAVYDGQLKALEKAKGHVDRSSQDRVVVKGAPSTASQYPAVKQYDLQSTQVGKQDGWSSLLGIGSDVVVPHLDPPTCGTIRWIGTSPQVLGYVAGVELKIALDGCTDGVWLMDGIRYFKCPPRKGYFCLLGQLEPDKTFMSDSVLELKKTLNETQDTLAQEKNFSQQYKHERDQAVMEHHQTKRERDQAVKICDQTKKERDQAVKECDQTKRERDQAVREHDQTKRERDQAVMEHHQTKKELEALREEHSRCRALWIVPRHHVMVTEKILGGGAWGYVKEGKFSGQQVAVKCVHEAIINQHTMKRVYREICTMSQVHHPNLVLFIAAVLDDKGGPMIITELLDTTLRKAYEDSLLKPGLDQCVAILRDVASALCYLHELEAPIIHRDVSSSNVLLQGLAKDKWKAKLSDFGSANWAKEASTMGEGAIVYTAPEAFPMHPSLDAKPPPQTTKIDVYSYGILLCEITLREFPNPATLHEMMAKLKARGACLHSMMQKCILKEPAQRPTMTKILQDLNEIGFTLNSQM